jgi:hypothetical protein
MHRLRHMKTYNNLLPKFTAEASLVSSKNARGILVYRLDYYYAENGNVLNMPQRHIDPRTWCNEDTPCDHSTHTRTICRWRDDIQDCVCVARHCTR